MVVWDPLLNTSASYVPAHTYACSFTSTLDSCLTLGEASPPPRARRFRPTAAAAWIDPVAQWLQIRVVRFSCSETKAASPLASLVEADLMTVALTDESARFITDQLTGKQQQQQQ